MNRVLKPWQAELVVLATVDNVTKEQPAARQSAGLAAAPSPYPGKNEKIALVAVLAVIAYSLIRNVLAAAAKPFWFDELCSVIISRQPTISGIWKALEGAADGQPPLFYLIERVASHLLPNERIAYRLPSIFAFGITLWCVFVFIRKRDRGFGALLCASGLLLTLAGTYYAVEARPYELVVACVAFALVCYQRTDRTPWVLALGLNLAAAEMLHYYGIFVVIPFGITELVISASRRHWRWGVWAALGAPLAPMLATWPLQMKLKQVYGGSHLANSPQLRTAAISYSEFFGIPSIKFFPHGGRAVAGAIFLFVLVMLIYALWSALMRAKRDDSFQGEVLAVMLFWLPLVAAAASKVLQGKFAGRYVLETLLGLPLAGAFLWHFAARSRAIALLAFVALFGSLAMQEASFWQSQAGHFGRAANPSLPLAKLVDSAGYDNLPVVVSDGGAYLQLMYYAPPELEKRLNALVDAPKAAEFAGTDNVDVELALLARSYPLKVSEFTEFAASHGEFLLYSNGGEWDWWPRRLKADHYSLKTIAESGSQRLYLIKRG